MSLITDKEKEDPIVKQILEKIVSLEKQSEIIIENVIRLYSQLESQINKLRSEENEHIE